MFLALIDLSKLNAPFAVATVKYYSTLSQTMLCGANNAKNPLMQAQPKERGIRYDNPSSAISEERLLQLCLSDTKLLDEAGGMLMPEQFSSPLLGSIFQKALDSRAKGEHVSPASLLLGLEDNETRHISAVLTQALPSADPVTEMKDCIKKINFEYIKRSGNGDDLFDLILAQKRSREK